ncbi:methyl-accepting chemotaxis protein [Rhizobium paknamense]|uniref:Methyl-accepting chemotaxis protein n=1 Tax=Rhizobium paknamense TaxID=1206817 RepID=A0ABU0I921_9HYPH|nr:methyl-accepting chemotaxis protein [Rhizobium paknamense]MDQ0454736.1 methyl-accepting chemotaxis protein [Rhizobium paknamense]
MTFVNNQKIIVKIMFAFAVLLMLSISVAISNRQSLENQDDANRLMAHTYQVTGALDKLMLAMVDQETGLRGFTLAADDIYLEPQKAGAASFSAQMTALRALTADNPAQQARLDVVERNARDWTSKIMEPRIALVRNPARRAESLDPSNVNAGKVFMDAIRSTVEDMKQDELQLLRARDAASDQALADARFMNVAGGAVSILIVLVALFAIHRTVVHPVKAINGAMRKLAGGDTQSAIPHAGRKDEVGEMAKAVQVFREAAIANKRLEAEAEETRQRAEAERAELAAKAEAEARARMNEATSGLANGLKRLASGDLAFRLTDAFAPDFEGLRHDLNAAVEQLGQTLSAVAHATGAIDGGAREVSLGADDLSKRTEQQAASLEETAAALDQITANVSNSAKRVEDARHVAVEANASASHSGQVVSQAVSAMERIEGSATQISNIIGVIDEIAFQTNLLALNAGVEAARAGEAGKGFAVVAQEVRELAQRSANAAKEIKELIRKSTEEVGGGVTLVRETGAALKTIEQHIVTMNQHMEAIALASREQATALAEVNSAVNQMDQVTQQNAAMVEQTSAAGSALAGEAHRLRDLVAQFRLEAAAKADRWTYKAA